MNSSEMRGCPKSIEEVIYSAEDLATVDLNRTPKCIGVIMDGNRRWAEIQGVSSSFGHMAGGDTLTELVKAAKQLRIETFIVFAFSTENWKRLPEEVEAIFQIFEQFLADKTPLMIEESVRLTWIGDLHPLPLSLKSAFQRAKERTAKGSVLDLVLAVNYGGRDEIVRATRALCHEALDQKINPEAIDEAVFQSHLDTAHYPDVDLLIRTGGEIRLSNFLLWQSYYAELYFTETLWPEFDPAALLTAVRDYQQKQRRRGV